MTTQAQPQIVKDIQANQVTFYVFTTYRPHVRTSLFFIISQCQNAAMSSCHHVIMSSCHHAVKDFGTQGERVMRPGVRHGLAMTRDHMRTGESNKKKRMEQPPEGSFHPPFFDSNIVPRRANKVPRSAAIMTGSRWGIGLLTRAPGARSWASTFCRRASRQRRRTTCRCGGAHR